jgi:hypothetical protein
MADKVTEPTVEVAAVEKVTINLKYELQTNGEAVGPGRVTVTTDIADDLLRREAEYDIIEKERLQSKEIMIDVSKATGQVFSGAGVSIPE